MQKGFTESFTSANAGAPILIKPGETLMYMLEMSGSDEAVATILLEYSQDGGARWFTEYNTSDSAISYTGTITGLKSHGWKKNETPKNKLYRWRCTAYTSGTMPTTLSNHIQPKYKFTDDVCFYVDNAAPASGIDGDGAQLAGKGSLYIDSDTGILYRNDGNSRMPSWVTASK